MTTELEVTGTRQEYGFPEKPDARQVQCWTRQELFLAEYSNCGAINVSAAGASISVEGYNYWLTADTYSFQKRFGLAQQQYLEKMAIEADRRAIEGVDHPVIHQGVITDTYKTYSDNLLMFRMKKLDPSYREAAITVELGMDQLLSYMQKRQAEDSQALPPADKIIEHVSSDDVPPWSEK